MLRRSGAGGRPDRLPLVGQTDRHAHDSSHRLSAGAQQRETYEQRHTDRYMVEKKHAPLRNARSKPRSFRELMTDLAADHHSRLRSPMAGRGAAALLYHLVRLHAHAALHLHDHDLSLTLPASWPQNLQLAAQNEPAHLRVYGTSEQQLKASSHFTAFACQHGAYVHEGCLFTPVAHQHGAARTSTPPSRPRST